MLERLLEEIKAKGFHVSLLQGWEKDQWQCNIYLGNRLNYVCACELTPLTAVSCAWILAANLRQVRPAFKSLELPDITNLLSDLPTHNID